VPCGRYGSAADLLHDRELAARGLFSEVRDNAGVFNGINAPWQMSASVTSLGDRVPTTGEHTEEVFSDLIRREEEQQVRQGATNETGGGA
jgi:crotonobetainyl-CoA:carnitine CoA-transferase CaiB-like acyl-CoA transferase